MPILFILLFGAVVAGVAYAVSEKQAGKTPVKQFKAPEQQTNLETKEQSEERERLITQAVTDLAEELNSEQALVKLKITREEQQKIQVKLEGHTVYLDLRDLPTAKGNFIKDAILAENGNKPITKEYNGVVYTLVFQVKPQSESEKKLAVKEAAVKQLSQELEGRTVKSTSGKLYVIRRGSKEGLWSLVSPTDPTDTAGADFTVKDINDFITDGHFSFT